jgi:hypothetical protein
LVVHVEFLPEPKSLEEQDGGLLHVTNIELNPSPSPGASQRILGAMKTLEGHLSTAADTADTEENARLGLDTLNRMGTSVAAGQKLDLFPISGTGAYHVNPTNGRCLFGKLKDGSCRLHPRPKFKTTAYLNLPPERGPPDANGFRSEPPVKFPKALISVAGERERVLGDAAFRQKVKEKMKDTEGLEAKLQKVKILQEL